MRKTKKKMFKKIIFEGFWTTFHKKQHLGAKLGMTGTFAIVAKLFLKISCVSAVREYPFYVPCPRPVLTDRRGVS